MRFFALLLTGFIGAPAIAQAPAEPPPCAPLLVYNQDPTIAAPFAALVARTPADYPPSMLRAGSEAACLVLFDVDAEGKPTNVEARCNATVAQASSSSSKADFGPMARYYAERAVGCSQYEPANDAAASSRWRSNLMTPLIFQLPEYSGPPGMPALFERANAAAPITVEQVALYEDRLRQENTRLADVRAKRAAAKAAAEASKSASKPKPN
jgi:hypothetical protein